MSGVVGQSKGHVSGRVGHHPFLTPAFEVYASSIGSIFANNVNTKIIHFDIVQQDTHGMWSTSSDQMTVPVGHAGIYQITLQVNSHQVDDGETSNFRMVIDGHLANYSQSLPGMWYRSAHQTDDTFVTQILCEIGLLEGQTVEFYWKQASGGTIGMDRDYVRVSAFRICGLNQ